MAWPGNYTNGKQTPHRLEVFVPLVSVDALLGFFGSDIQAWQRSCALHTS